MAGMYSPAYSLSSASCPCLRSVILFLEPLGLPGLTGRTGLHCFTSGTLSAVFAISTYSSVDFGASGRVVEAVFFKRLSDKVLLFDSEDVASAHKVSLGCQFADEGYTSNIGSTIQISPPKDV